MVAFPKPTKSKRSGNTRPQLTEYEFIEIGENLNNALVFKNEVEITVFHRKKHEKFVGIVTSADGQTGILLLRVGYEDLKIGINDIINVEEKKVDW